MSFGVGLYVILRLVSLPQAAIHLDGKASTAETCNVSEPDPKEAGVVAEADSRGSDGVLETKKFYEEMEEAVKRDIAHGQLMSNRGSRTQLDLDTPAPNFDDLDNDAMIKVKVAQWAAQWAGIYVITDDSGAEVGATVELNNHGGPVLKRGSRVAVIETATTEDGTRLRGRISMEPGEGWYQTSGWHHKQDGYSRKGWISLREVSGPLVWASPVQDEISKATGLVDYTAEVALIEKYYSGWFKCCCQKERRTETKTGLSRLRDAFGSGNMTGACKVELVGTKEVQSGSATRKTKHCKEVWSGSTHYVNADGKCEVPQHNANFFQNDLQAAQTSVSDSMPNDVTRHFYRHMDGVVGAQL